MHALEKLIGFIFVGLIGLVMVGNYIYQIFFNKETLKVPGPEDPPDEWFQL